MTRNAPTAIVDFESRSACNLKNQGAWVYSTHPTTQILCMVWRMPWWDEGRTSLWHPEFKHLGMEEACETEAVGELCEWIEAGELLEAHNAAFERGVWTNILAPRFGFPTIRIEQWRCSAAKAAAHALPRNLDGAGNALGLTELKDAEGHALMLKLSKPRKPRKKEREEWLKTHPSLESMPLLWHESKTQFERLHAYCRQDVLAEEAVSSTLIDLSPDETEIYTLDQRINERGFQLDMEAPRIALSLITTESENLNSELSKLTSGAVTKATQREKIKSWLRTQGLDLANTQGATIDALLADAPVDGEIEDGADVGTVDADSTLLGALPPIPRRALEIVRTLGRSSTAKYRKMLDWAGDDGRVRGGLLYHGASTGRWPITGDHETLTPNGWVRLDKWNGGSIACWQPNGTISFQPATRLRFTLPKEEQLVHWVNSKVDQLSTADHSMAVYPRRRCSLVSGKVWGGGFARKTIDAVSPGDRIPLYGLYDAQPKTWPLTVDETRVLVMTQADGHYTRENGRALRFRFKKERKIERCKELLSYANVPYAVRVDQCDGVTVITVPYATMPEWLWTFDKVFDWMWLNAPKYVIFEELVHWDGCKSSLNGIDYSTTVQQNADVIQALAHLSRRTCLVMYRDRSLQGWSDTWRCFIDNDPAPTTFRKSQRTEVQTGHDAVYCAETPTGYFLVRRNGKVWVTGNSGAGIQPHNFPKGSIKDFDMEAAWGALKHGVNPYPAHSIMEVLSCALRGVIVAREGYELYVADFASIEARVLLWLARDERGLDIFRRHEDPYCDMASAIYDRPITKADKSERGLGKIACLGLGYQMGWSKFQATCANFGIVIDDEMAERVVHIYREKYRKVKQLWYDTEDAACEAVSRKGVVVKQDRVSWVRRDRFLYCVLPSGRQIAYPAPELRKRQTPWGAEKWALTFMGVNSFNRQWQRQTTYGGCLVENADQSVSRDLMAAALQRTEESGTYIPVLSIHDESIAEAKIGTGSVKEFEMLTAEVPTWADGMPIVAEGFRCARYRK